MFRPAPSDDLVASATGSSRPDPAGDPAVALASRLATPPREAGDGYRASSGTRMFGGAGTAVALLIGAGLLLALGETDRPRRSAPPLEVMMLPPPAPPREPQRPVVAPKAVPPKTTAPAPRPVTTAPAPIVATPAPSQPVAIAAPARPDPSPQAPVQAAAPAPAPSPPAPPQASHGPDRWEARVLARIERFRHYPGDAQRAHRQGTAYVRFRIDRTGHLLSSSLDRSSGDAELDAAAMDTIRRSDPLPKVPDDRPDTVELVVPIEFSVH